MGTSPALRHEATAAPRKGTLTPMPGQIVLQWTVDVTNTPLGAAAAATRLGAVTLYANAVTDPVLGQLFGLTVDSDVTDNPDASTARRTLTLNMDTQNSPTAPPPFPCRPRTSTPPVLPYPLREAVTLPGSFIVTDGSAIVPTTATQVPSLNIGDILQFLEQQGVFYEVAAVTATTVTLTAPYTGRTTNTGAFKEIPAPVPLALAAIFSTSELDTNGVATTPAIPAGSGARTVELQYNDSTGAGPFEAEAELTGKRPAIFVFDIIAGIDIAEIVALTIDSAGAFENNVGQLTLVELSSALTAIPAGTTPGTGRGMIEGASEAIGITNTFTALTDQAQLLIDRKLAYLPPSYYALSQQGASQQQLVGDFFVTTGSTNVPTTNDQMPVLGAGNNIVFASQPDVAYTIATVTAKIVTLTTPYTGIDDNFTGGAESAKVSTKGNIGTKVILKQTGAYRVGAVDVGRPTDAQLSAPLGQYVETQVAAPPPGPPFPPATVPAPTVLSGIFTRQLQLALAGIPVVPATITFP